ncbi:hypothetical protein K461DRAFT_276703 [Myriangium duriaei CBS 260.36]|uniref:Uncharacterized protein n=1 Tax=Myriangium duriaei CBS 260.36 TaxID=1168546 RepID=A0A9P4J565_9PEZI|nr:hypothetical protein K461DRAFT_276703 [Myriangium duriaei CBS 260.36]
MEHPPLPSAGHSTTNTTTTTTTFAPSSPFSLSTQLSSFYKSTGHIAMPYVYAALTTHAQRYVKSDPSRAYLFSRRTRLAVTAACFPLELWYLRAEGLGKLFNLWQTGGSAWGWGWGVVGVVAAAVYAVCLGTLLPDMVGAALLWRSRGGRITARFGGRVVAVVLFFVCAAVAVHLLPVATLELMFAPVMVLLGEHVGVEKVRRSAVELALATACLLAAWALLRKQDGVKGFVEPILGHFRKNQSDEEKEGTKKVPQDVKHSSDPKLEAS